MYCPNCGKQIDIKNKWKDEDPMAGTRQAEVDCSICKKKLKCIDATAIEGSDEIVIIYK